MEIHYSQSFRKNFLKRVPAGTPLEKRYKSRLKLFIENKKNEVLRDHKLTGKLKNYRAFSIKGDFRVIYVDESKGRVLFINIGTHNQVYS